MFTALAHVLDKSALYGQGIAPARILLAKSLRLFVRATASPQPSPRSGEGWGEAVALWIRQQYPQE